MTPLVTSALSDGYSTSTPIKKFACSVGGHCSIVYISHMRLALVLVFLTWELCLVLAFDAMTLWELDWLHHSFAASLCANVTSSSGSF